MPERFSLYTDLSVEENMNFFAAVQQVPAAAGAKSSRNACWKEPGWSPFRKRRAGALSGGMKQKLALSTILLSSPELIILDEPTTGVDPLSRIEFFAIIEALKNEGKTIVMSTPYLDEAEKGDHIVFIKNGRVMRQDSIAGLREFLPGPAVPHPAAGQHLRSHGSAVAAIPGLGGQAHMRGKFIRYLQTGTENLGRLHPAPGDGRGKADPGRHVHLLREAAMNAPVPAIAVRDLRKSFGRFQAVKGISFDVAPGEIVGFLGPNGAGKTTTIKMITGLLKITSGTVLINGLDNRKHLAEIKKKLGYMSQKFSLYPLLTALENIEFFGGISGLAAARNCRQHMARMDEQVAADILRQKIQDVPPGIRQKVALFVCLLPEPEIILLDEPTSGVDPEARRLFWNEIYGLKKRGKTLLVSTHNLDEAEYCDRIIIIHNGEIVACRRAGRTAAPKAERRTSKSSSRTPSRNHGQN